jgi:hypothetical protein
VIGKNGCEKCGEDCEICDSFKKCKQCRFGYKPDPISGQCLEASLNLQSNAEKAEKNCALGCVKCN